MVVPHERILEQVEGATIASCYVEDEDGLHLCLTDGRILIFVGQFCIGLVSGETRELH